MKCNFLISAALTALFVVTAQAEVSDAQMKAFKKECKGYAAEENVPEEEMQGYVEQCVQDLVASEQESAGEPEEKGDQE